MHPDKLDIDPFNLGEPSSYLLLAATLAYAANICCRGLLLFATVHPSFMTKDDVNPIIRLMADVIFGVLVYFPLGLMYALGIMLCWHVSHVSGVIIGSVLGAAFTCGCCWLRTDDKAPWLIHHYRWQRRNLLCGISVMLAIAIGLADAIWHYKQPTGTYLFLTFLVILDLGFFEKFEVSWWKCAGVNIVGSLETPLDKRLAC